jgi:hypothetical protein
MFVPPLFRLNDLNEMSYPDATPRQYGGLYLWTDLDNKAAQMGKAQGRKGAAAYRKAISGWNEARVSRVG